jgi:hypothetical protein
MAKFEHFDSERLEMSGHTFRSLMSEAGIGKLSSFSIRNKEIIILNDEDFFHHKLSRAV